MVVMCEQSCSVLLIEAIKNYEMEIPEGKSLWLIIALLILSVFVQSYLLLFIYQSINKL